MSHRTLAALLPATVIVGIAVLPGLAQPDRLPLADRSAAARVSSLPGDYDGDGDIDSADYAAFPVCMTGPDVAPAPPCAPFDFEPDGDVDLADFAGFSHRWHWMLCNNAATASSTENDDPQYDAAMAVDGNFLTRWASAWADDQWLQLDMGRERSFNGLEIYWETAHASAYDVQVSNNATSWTTVYSTTTGTGGYPDDISFPPQAARYLRIRCVLRATQWGNSIWELVLKSDDTCFHEPLDVEQRIDDLVAVMTLEEKTSFVYGQSAMQLRTISRLGIPSLKLSDGPVGIHWDQATAFPSAIAMSSTWDVDLVGRVGVAIGKELKNKGRQIWLGPCMNIVRVPHGGRNFETYGEDPWLNSRMAVAMIRGAQSERIVACAKHYACNNQEYDRFNINIQVDERTLREIYWPAFKASVQEAGVWAVMSAYNRLNGPYCTANAYLQTDVLKNQWGFQGFVVSDWGAVHSTVASANGGLDLEMDGNNPTGTWWGNGQLLAAVNAGQVTEATVNDKVRRILRPMFATGMLTIPWPAPDVEMVEHRALAREVAGAGIVLLKNESAILPLDKNATQTIALIGPNYKDARVGGGGSSEVWPYYAIGPLEGIQNAVGPNVTLVEAVGVPLGGSPPAVDTSYLTPPSGIGHGLLGQYYNNVSLQGAPVLTRTDPTVDFHWGSGSPGGGVNANGYSVRWTGTLQVPLDGTYDLGMTTDDGVRLYLGGALLIDDWHDHAAQLTQVSVSLAAGVPYDLVIEYYENAGDAVAVLSCVETGAALAEAVDAAAGADVAIVFAGLSSAFESEGYDRSSMDLDSAQVDLIQSVAAANPNTIVVMITGSQVGMADWIDDVPAMLQAWYLGQEGGNAIADVLFGDANPSGKLPVTFIRRWEDHPAYTNYPGGVYSEGLFVGYRHYDEQGIDPLFPFGHGLGYTTFQYSNLVIDASTVSVDGRVRVSLNVQNTGPRAGAEVVQLYVRDVVSSVERPPRELKAFTKVDLDPGEMKEVSFDLDDRAWSFYDVANARWYAEPGVFEIQVGSSSRDIRLTGAFDLE